VLALALAAAPPAYAATVSGVQFRGGGARTCWSGAGSGTDSTAAPAPTSWWVDRASTSSTAAPAATRSWAGRGPDAVFADGGRDLIRAADGDHDLIRCGPGTDRAFVDRSDETTGCERVVCGWPG
jgi:hypothetical protein